MDLRLLKTFRMVAETMSFSRAATALDYAQSTVTGHIQALETSFGLPLFNRIGKQIELTDAGRRLLYYSERLLDLEAEMHTAVTGTQTLTGTLTIGAPETVCTYLLPAVLKRYHEAMPEVRLIFKPMAYEQLFRSVKDGKVDIAFLLEQSIHTSGMCVETLTHEPLVILASPEHPLAMKADLNLDDLNGQPLLLTEKGCGYRHMFERAMQEAGVTPARAMEFDSVEAIKQCVIANVGIAALPHITVQRELQAETLVALNMPIPNFQIRTQMLWHKDKWVSPAMAAFLNISRDTLGNL